MVLRFKTNDGEKIVDTDYVEIEDVYSTEVSKGKWVFKSESDQN